MRERATANRRTVTIVSRIFAPEPAAASSFLEALARNLSAEGHKVTVLTVTSSSSKGYVAIPGLQIRRFPVLRDASGYVRGYLPYLSFDIPLFFRLLFRRRSDIYFVEPPPTTGAIVRIALALLRRPYFYDAADIWSDAAKLATSSHVVLRLLRHVEIFALGGARRAFTISEGVSARMKELGLKTPTTVIGFGVDTAVFRFRAAKRESASSPYFIYAGTYSEWHGASIFVEGFARFASTHPEYRLKFVGNGSDRPRLEALCLVLGILTVDFCDPVDGAVLSELLAGATASLACLKPDQGYDYAFTTKVYAALAVGCPVIFAGVGPTVQFLKEAAVVHRAGIAVEYDPSAVAAAMDDAANSPTTSEDRRALSGWARANYSLDAVAHFVVAGVLREVVP